MKLRAICVVILYLLSLQVVACDFCHNSMKTTLDKVLSSPHYFLNKRIKMRAVLRTDAKAYVRISLSENSKFSILTTADDESTAYNERYGLSNKPPFNVRKDLFDKLRALGGVKYNKDLSKIRYYRQIVIVCGRLIESNEGLRFAVDDMQVLSSYLIPWKTSQQSGSKIEFKSFTKHSN